MEYILINSIGEFPEDFLFAKVDVEKKLIEDGIIDKRMKLEEFILYLNLQDKVYMDNQKGIAFSILEGENNDYVFYSFLDATDTDKLFESFKKKIEGLKFKFDSLRKLEPMELIQDDILNGELFILNSVICK